MTERDTRGKSVDWREPRSEVHSTFIKLTWQNACSLAVIVALAVTGYLKLTAADAAMVEHQKQTDATVGKVIQIQERQQDWMTDIAVKVGVPTPPRRPGP